MPAKSAVKWQWQDNDGTFKDFPVETNKTIEELYHANSFSGKVKAKLTGKIVYGWYEYDFDADTQENCESKKVRNIQRTLNGAVVKAKKTTPTKWQWQDDHGKWHDYDAPTTALLEKEYFTVSPGAPTTTAKIGTYNYTIDFGAMMQINQASKKSRNMLRTGDTPGRVFTVLGKKSAAGTADDEPPSKKSKVDTTGKSAITGGGKAKMIKKGRGVVDVKSGMADTCHIYDDGSVVWQCMLNQTNIDQNNNKYYVIQLLETDATPSKYHLWTRWGRVGAEGQTNLDQLSLEGAKSNFRKKFRDKTSNDWTNKESFVKVPGKYQLMDMDYGEDTKAVATTTSGTAAAGAANLKSKLDPEVQALIKLISNKTGMEDTMKELNVDIDKMPLGKISKKQIKEGFSYLKQIETELKNSSPNKSQLQKYSSMFYTLIPHDFGMALPPTIATDDLLKRKMELLDVLSDLEIASTLLGKAKSTGVHPFDHAYFSLNCPLQVVHAGSPDYKRIETYMRNTHGKTHSMYSLSLTACYKVDRAGEATRYKPYEKLHNKYMLWHGSRCTNFMGILSQGLRIAPPEAPVTGYMYGKGIYLADSSSKSANYCHATPSNSESILVLCETALGTLKRYTKAQYMDKPQPGTNSTMGEGKYIPDSKGDEVVDGVVWPTGKLVDSSKSTVLLYNEYIVYDVSQLKIKYLLKVRFNYGKKY